MARLSTGGTHELAKRRIGSCLSPLTGLDIVAALSCLTTTRIKSSRHATLSQFITKTRRVRTVSCCSLHGCPQDLRVCRSHTLHTLSTTAAG